MLKEPRWGEDPSKALIIPLFTLLRKNYFLQTGKMNSVKI